MPPTSSLFQDFENILTGTSTSEQCADFVFRFHAEAQSEDLPEYLTKIIQTASLQIDSDEYSLPIVDLFGTGGDGLGTVNISTLAGLVAASTGLVKVAKYGNRSASGICGSMDFLEDLGINIDLEQAEMEKLLDQTGYCPIFARNAYQSAKQLGQARKAFGKPTLLNLLFPLARPVTGKKKVFVFGCSKIENMEILADILKKDESVHCMIVRGDDGSDEVSTSGNGITSFILVNKGERSSSSFSSLELFGIAPSPISHLQISTRQEAFDLALLALDPRSDGNNEKIKAVRNAIIANAALALFLAYSEDVNNLEKVHLYTNICRNALESGATLRLIKNVVDRSNAEKDFLQRVEKCIKLDAEYLRIRREQNRFLEFLKQGSKEPMLIGEIKPRSPSEGKLYDGDLTQLAKEYESAGVNAISVLTEQQFFGGSLELLRKIRSRTSLPILRKDFILSRDHILETKEIGADAVLLIADLLDPETLKDLTSFSLEIGLEPIIEIQNETELEIALQTSVRCIAVNARNLRTLEIDISRAKEVLKKIPANYYRFFFSSIGHRSEVETLKEIGVSGYLVGTSLMKSDSPTAKILHLLYNHDEHASH